MTKLADTLTITFVLLLLLLTSALGFAAEEEPKVPSDWWLKSSLDPSAQHDGLLKKIDLSLTYNNISGNTDGYVLGGSSSLTLRKDRYTGLLSYEINKKDVSQSDDTVKSEKWTAILAGQYDLASIAYLGGAYILEEDTNHDIDLRKIYVAGLGGYLLSSEQLKLNLFLGGGQTDEEYDDIVEYYTSLDHRTYDIFYLYQTFDWQITEWLLLSQGFRLIHSLSKMNEFDWHDETSSAFVSGKSERNLISAKIEFQAPIHKSLNVFSSYKYEYDSHPWPGNESTDSLTTIGIRFTYL